MAIEREFLNCGRYYGSEGGAGNLDVKSVLLGKNAVYAPDRSADTVHIRLELNVDVAKKTIDGICTATMRAFRDGVKEIGFDAHEMRIGKVFWAGKPCKFDYDGKKLTLRLPKALSMGDEGAAAIHYKLKNPRAGLHFISRSRTNGPQVWTQSQPEDARFWFPCHDAPQEKATSEMVVTVPGDFIAISNGLLVQKRKQNGKAVFHWRMSRPHSVYLISLAAGRFSEVKDNWENIPVLYFCEKGREADAKRGFGKTPQMLDFFSKKIGVRYAYEHYAQVAVAKYPGGMEHTTCTTQTDAALMDARAALDTDFDGLVAHELAHQWFGDLLTCKDWSHAWLNEGFATYFEVLFTEHDKGNDEALYELWRYAHNYFGEDQGRYRRPIVSANFKYPWVIFDRHLYEKGASVLHMIRYLLRDTDWWRAIGLYVSKHKDGSVETADLLSAIQEATGKNLKSFFDQWVFGVGYPRFKAQYAWDAAKKEASIWLLQTQGEGPFKLPLEFYFEGEGWEKTFTENVEKKEHRFTFKLPAEPLQADVDPHRWILKRVEFLKPLKLWKRQLTNGANSVARLEAAQAVGRWGNAEAVKALSDAFRSESFWGTRCEIAMALGHIGTESAVSALKGMLTVRHPKIRRSVVEALGSSGRPESAALLKPLLTKDASYLVEAEAARSLGRLRDPKLLGVLAANLNKKSWYDVVRSGVLTGIANTRDIKAISLLKRHLDPSGEYTGRASAIRGLASLHTEDPGVLDMIIPLIDDEDERIKLVAIAGLENTGDVRSLAALEKARDTQVNPRVRTRCDEAIAKIRAGVEKDGGPVKDSGKNAVNGKKPARRR